MENLYTVPRDVRLDSAGVRSALASVGIDAHSYVANGVVNHVFVNRTYGAKLSVVVGEESKRLSEVVGDTSLWRTVRSVATNTAVLRRTADEDPSVQGKRA